MNFDAWSAVAAANEFNDASPSGDVDVMASLTVTYLGSGTSSLSFGFDINIGTVGSAGVLYTDWQNGCGVLPDPSDLDFSSVFQGGTVTYNQCWQVPASDVSSLELDYTNSSNGFFALH